MSINATELLRNPGRGPHSDVKPSELVRRLMDSKRPSEVLPFPRTDADGKPIFEYQMMVLTQEELDSCIANAERYTRTTISDKTGSNEDISNVRREAWSEIYENAKCVELLYEAMRQPDDINKRLFMSPSEIRRHLTIDECALLFKSYEAVQFRFGPIWKLLSDDEIEAWVTTLSEGASSYPLEHMGQGALTQLVISLALRLHMLRTAIVSSGSPSEDGATSTSPQSNDDAAEATIDATTDQGPVSAS